MAVADTAGLLSLLASSAGSHSSTDVLSLYY